MKSFLINLFILGALVSQKALAQDTPPITRKGFVFGISAGTGFITTSVPNNKNDVQFGHLSYNWKTGFMINNSMAILLQGGISTYSYQGNLDSPRERLRGFEGLIPSFQYYATDKLWITGGIGLGMDNPVFYDVKDESEGNYYAGGYKAALSSGYEIWQRKNKALDIQGRLSFGNAQVSEGKRNSLAFDLLIGFNVY